MDGTQPFSSLTDQQRADWLRLIRTESIGPAKFRRLLNQFGSAAAALDVLPRLLRNGGSTKPLSIPSIDSIEAELASIAHIGARLIGIGEAEYPELLRHIPAPPPLITVLGGDTILNNQALAIVGARNASAAGQRLTRIVAAEMGQAGFTIVSGLARGIDTAAHQASLETGTIAVLAGGLDQLYPAENAGLAQQIVENGGALLSEMPMGWVPRARDFPRRNRLVSGLALGVLVVEAAARSGSLITARLALEQNRDVMAIPGSPLDPRAEGANLLIRQGARLVRNASDIIEELVGADPAKHLLFEPESDHTWEAPDSAPTQSDDVSQDARTLLLNALGIAPITIDELIQETALTSSQVQTILLELDLADRIEWSGGQRVSLCN